MSLTITATASLSASLAVYAPTLGPVQIIGSGAAKVDVLPPCPSRDHPYLPDYLPPGIASSGGNFANFSGAIKAVARFVFPQLGIDVTGIAAATAGTTTGSIIVTAEVELHVFTRTGSARPGYAYRLVPGSTFVYSVTFGGASVGASVTVPSSGPSLEVGLGCLCFASAQTSWGFSYNGGAQFGTASASITTPNGLAFVPSCPTLAGTITDASNGGTFTWDCTNHAHAEVTAGSGGTGGGLSFPGLPTPGSSPGGEGANLVMPGLYTFTRGIHRAGTPNAHEAFRELSEKLIVRTADDGTYEPESDRIEIDSPCDNLHAAWGIDTFSSAGCQVVSGKPGEGPWGLFKERGYAAGLSQYRYLLLPASTWKALIAAPDEPMVVIGSRGERAKAVQQALIDKGFLTGYADGVFGCQSGLALLKWQRSKNEVVANAVCSSTDARLLGVSI